MRLIFLRPEAFFWLLLAVPLVAGYLRRDRMTRQVVATQGLWRAAVGERSIRTRWMRWRRVASLVMQLTILSTMVLAMAEPDVRDAGRAFVGQAFQPGSYDASVRLESLTYECWPCLTLVAVTALAVEWRLFQRRWTC